MSSPSSVIVVACSSKRKHVEEDAGDASDHGLRRSRRLIGLPPARLFSRVSCHKRPPGFSLRESGSSSATATTASSSSWRDQPVPSIESETDTPGPRSGTRYRYESCRSVSRSSSLSSSPAFATPPPPSYAATPYRQRQPPRRPSPSSSRESTPVFFARPLPSHAATRERDDTAVPQDANVDNAALANPSEEGSDAPQDQPVRADKAGREEDGGKGKATALVRHGTTEHRDRNRNHQRDDIEARKQAMPAQPTPPAANPSAHLETLIETLIGQTATKDDMRALAVLMRPTVGRTDLHAFARQMSFEHQQAMRTNGRAIFQGLARLEGNIADRLGHAARVQTSRMKQGFVLLADNVSANINSLRLPNPGVDGGEPGGAASQQPIRDLQDRLRASPAQSHALRDARTGVDPTQEAVERDVPPLTRLAILEAQCDQDEAEYERLLHDARRERQNELDDDRVRDIEARLEDTRARRNAIQEARQVSAPVAEQSQGDLQDLQLQPIDANPQDETTQQTTQGSTRPLVQAPVLPADGRTIFQTVKDIWPFTRGQRNDVAEGQNVQNQGSQPESSYGALSPGGRTLDVRGHIPEGHARPAPTRERITAPVQTCDIGTMTVRHEDFGALREQLREQQVQNEMLRTELQHTKTELNHQLQRAQEAETEAHESVDEHVDEHVISRAQTSMANALEPLTLVRFEVGDPPPGDKKEASDPAENANRAEKAMAGSSTTAKTWGFTTAKSSEGGDAGR